LTGDKRLVNRVTAGIGSYIQQPAEADEQRMLYRTSQSRKKNKTKLKTYNTQNT